MSKLKVRVVAQGHWRVILRAIGLDGKMLSGKHGPCPVCRGGRDRFRFDDKDGRGTWICSQCGAGDGVQLFMAVTGLSFRDAAREIVKLTGSPLHVSRTTERSEDEKLAALRAVWTAATPLHKGDLAWTYLLGRGIRLETLPVVLRLHPGLQYREGPEIQGVFPTMLAAVIGPGGRPVSIHRTYLKGGSKAPVPAPRKMMPGLGIQGAAVRLFPVAECLEAENFSTSRHWRRGCEVGGQGWRPCK